MGYDNRKYILVSMANHDVYHISREAADCLKQLLKDNTAKVYTVVDVKNMSNVSIVLSQISSIVMPGGDQRG